MLYTPMTKKALRLCFQVHKDQVDKSGMPYVFHPFHVAEQMATEEEICVALLHDVMEDGAITADDLARAGMSAPVIQALELLTRKPGMPYLDYVRNLAGNPLARAVKVADLHHNADLSRLDAVTPADRARAQKYAQALEILQAAQAAE
ncbi:MAG: GTP pyrophosphokinase [Eggerthellaceae bacterium]